MTTKEKIIIVAGDFDALTCYDSQFLLKCKEMGDWLIVGVHSDLLIHLKYGGMNNTREERHKLVENIKCVDEVFSFNDDDGTVCNLLKIVKLCYPLANITYVSDIDMHNMPETKIRGINFEILK